MFTKTLKSFTDVCFIEFLIQTLQYKCKFCMSIINLLLTDIRLFSFSPVIIEVSKVLLVSFGWIGGLTAFVWWKDKHQPLAA
jgi:hypothetical protein